MSILRRLMVLAVAGGGVALLAQESVASKATRPQYFDYTLEPKSLPDKSGPVELVLTFKMKPDIECDSVLVQVGAWKELVYDGPSDFWVSPAETGEYSTTFSVTVPPNDTTALRVRLSCQGTTRCIQSLTKTFITTGDAMELLDCIPTPRGPELGKKSASRYLVRTGESRDIYDNRHMLTEEQLQERRTLAIGLSDPEDFAFAESLLGSIPDTALIPGTRNAFLLEMTLDHLLRMTVDRGIRVDMCPEQTELVFEEDTQQPPAGPIIPADGIYRIPPEDMKVIPAEGRSADFDKPLRGYSGQIITTDSGDFRRYEGETEFHCVPVTSDYDLHMSRMKAFVDTVAAGEEFEIVIDLRDPDHRATADRLIHAKTPADTEGWYRATINKRTAQELLENHVVFVQYRQTDGREGVRSREDRTGSTGDSSNESESDPPPPPPNSASIASGYDLFWENFETGSWATTWYTLDLQPPSYDTWGRSEIMHSGGIASAWCSGDGVAIDGGGYAPFSWAHLGLRNPIDVSACNQIEIEWAYWAHIPHDSTVGLQVQYDFFEGGDYTWRQLESIKVSQSAWTVRRWLVPTQSSEVVLRFVFTSGDYTGHRGFYIDDVIIRDVSFNLKPYTPASWEYPIVPSSNPFGLGGSVGDLWAGEWTYVDLCFVNEGPSFCDGVEFKLFLDGVFMAEGSNTATLDGGQAVLAPNLPIVVSEGLHTLTATIYALDLGGTGSTEHNLYDNTFSHEWYWEVPQIEFSGYARYWDMNPEADSTLPIRNAVIDMLDDQGSDTYRLIASTTTDDFGHFSFPAVDNVDDPPAPSDHLDLYFRIHSENSVAKAKVANQEPYWESAKGTSLPSGVYDTTLVVPKNPLLSGPFYAADVLLDGSETWTSVGSGLSAPSQVDVEIGSSGTGYDTLLSRIELDMRDLAASAYPDTYDRNVILHEYGHHLEFLFDFMDSSPGASHEWNSIVTSDQAANEGFAYFVSCFLSANSEGHDRFNGFSDDWWYDAENGEWGDDIAGSAFIIFGSANHIDSTEAQVAGIFWDLYDQTDDNYSACNQTAANWPWTSTDNVLDSVQFDIGTILGVLLNKNADDGYLADDIDEFQEAWLNAPHSGRPAGMQDVYYEHGIACCTGKRGDVNGLGGETPTLGDVSWLIDYLFIDKPILPACVEEADVNGLTSGGTRITIGDITILIDHLFVDQAIPLADCPCIP